jgi:hypothetical protein
MDLQKICKKNPEIRGRKLQINHWSKVYFFEIYRALILIQNGWIRNSFCETELVKKLKSFFIWMYKIKIRQGFNS